jgi:hypothetical protein
VGHRRAIPGTSPALPRVRARDPLRRRGFRCGSTSTIRCVACPRLKSVALGNGRRLESPVGSGHRTAMAHTECSSTSPAIPSSTRPAKTAPWIWSGVAMRASTCLVLSWSLFENVPDTYDIEILERDGLRATAYYGLSRRDPVLGHEAWPAYRYGFREAQGRSPSDGTGHIAGKGNHSGARADGATIPPRSSEHLRHSTHAEAVGQRASWSSGRPDDGRGPQRTVGRAPEQDLSRGSVYHPNGFDRPNGAHGTGTGTGVAQVLCGVPSIPRAWAPVFPGQIGQRGFARIPTRALGTDPR